MFRFQNMLLFHLPRVQMLVEQFLFEVRHSISVEYKMTIFDRWGNQIFETNDLNKGWNGFVKDGTEIAQEDIYVYKIFVKDFQNKDHKYVGHVNIVK